MRGKPTRKLKKSSKAVLPPRKTPEEKANLEKEVDGLLPKWLKFIDEYFANGFNGTRAYMKVYSVKNEKVARSAATRLLSYVSVNKEVQYRLQSQQVTDDAIIGELWDVARNYRGEKTIGAAVSALQTLAKTKGMLTDVKKHVFDSNNPAVFNAPYSKEEAEKFKESADKLGRITE
jgi:hypothetical protein